MIDNALQKLHNHIGYGALDPDRQVLYDLVRIYKYRRILELGTDEGRGTSFLAAACHANGFGHVVAIDIDANSGAQIPDYLKPYITFIQADIDEWLSSATSKYDLVFEDGCHTRSQVSHVWGEHGRLLNEGGIIASHDIAAPDCGESVRQGIRDAGFSLDDIFIKLSPPSIYGLGIWRMM